MNKYRMKALRELDKAEEQVKQGVRMKLKEKPVHAQQKKRMPLFIGGLASLLTVVLLVFLVTPDEKELVVQGSGEFKIEEIELSPLKLRESSYIVTNIVWDGQQEAILEKVELVDFQGEPIQYHVHGIEMRPWKVSGVEAGQYRLNEISQFEEFSSLKFAPNSTEAVLFEVIGNSHYEPTSDFNLRLIYSMNGEQIIQKMDWATLDQIVVEQINFTEIAVALGMTEQEMAAYEAFKKEREAIALAGLTPISIARLYLLANIEGDDALQYAFYTEREESIAWSYEEQLKFPAFDRLSLDEAVELIEAVSSGTFVETGDGVGYIAFTMKGLEQGFQMLKNEEGIWQVAFMPMQ